MKTKFIRAEFVRNQKLTTLRDRDAAVEVAEAIAMRDGFHLTKLTSDQIGELRNRGFEVEAEQHHEGEAPTWRVTHKATLSRWEQADLNAAAAGRSAWLSAPSNRSGDYKPLVNGGGKLNTMASQLDAVFKK